MLGEFGFFFFWAQNKVRILKTVHQSISPALYSVCQWIVNLFFRENMESVSEAKFFHFTCSCSLIMSSLHYAMRPMINRSEKTSRFSLFDSLSPWLPHRMFSSGHFHCSNRMAGPCPLQATSNSTQQFVDDHRTTDQQSEHHGKTLTLQQTTPPPPELRSLSISLKLIFPPPGLPGWWLPRHQVTIATYML